MAVNINASLSSGIGITPDNSGVIQFQSNGANTISIQANGAVLTASGTNIAAPASGTLIRAPQILTTGTSYTTPVNCSSIYIELVGGGGGGAGSVGLDAGAGRRCGRTARPMSEP